MLAGKKLTDYANLFSLHDFKKNANIILPYFKNVWRQFYRNNWQNNFIWQTKFLLSEITGIENYLYQEIDQRKSCSKKLNKYVTGFDYIDKILIVLSVASSGVSIISFTTIVGAPLGIESSIVTLIFSLATGIVKKLLNITRNKKKKHDKILMLAKSKLSSIETSQALIEMDTSHEEFVTILKQKDKYEKMKESLRSENKEYKIMTLISIKSKIKKK